MPMASVPLPLPMPAIAPVAAQTGLAGATGADGSMSEAAGGGGDGNGGGTGHAPQYAAAQWISKAPADDIRRLWVGNSRAATAPTVTVAMVCRIMPGYKPRHCRVSSTVPPVFGFPQEAVRLVELSKVRPVLKDGSETDLPVFITIIFHRPPPR